MVDYLGFQTQRTAEFKNGGRPIPRVAARSLAETWKTLKTTLGNGNNDCGISPNFFPPCLGGFYNYRSFDEFIRSRLTIEGVMSAAPLHGSHPISITVFDEESEPEQQQQQQPTFSQGNQLQRDLDQGNLIDGLLNLGPPTATPPQDHEL